MHLEWESVSQLAHFAIALAMQRWGGGLNQQQYYLLHVQHVCLYAKIGREIRAKFPF